MHGSINRSGYTLEVFINKIVNKMSSQLNITVRPEVRLDAKWLKTDIQRFLYRDGLAELWNEMVRDGEIVGSFSDGLVNAAGIVAKKGK